MLSEKEYKLGYDKFNEIKVKFKSAVKEDDGNTINIEYECLRREENENKDKKH